MNKVPTDNQLARIDAYSRFTGGNARVAAVMAGAILDEQDPLGASSDLTATLDRMTDYYRALLERMPPNTRKVFDALVRGGEPASQVEVAARIGARQNDISRAFGWLVDWGYVVDDYEPKKKDHRYHVADRLFVQFYKMRYLHPGERPQLAILTDLLATTIEFREKWNFAERYQGEGLNAESQLLAELACIDRGVDVQLLPEGMRTTDELLRLGKDWMRWDEIAGGDMFQALRKLVNGPNPIRTNEAFCADFERLRSLAIVKAQGSPAAQKMLEAEIVPSSTSTLPHYVALAKWVSSDSDIDPLRTLGETNPDISEWDQFASSPLGLTLLVGVAGALKNKREVSCFKIPHEEILDWVLLSSTLMNEHEVVGLQDLHFRQISELFGDPYDDNRPKLDVFTNAQALEGIIDRNPDAASTLRLLSLIRLAALHFHAGAPIDSLCAMARAYGAASAPSGSRAALVSETLSALRGPLVRSINQAASISESIDALLRATKFAERCGDPVPLREPWVVLIRRAIQTEDQASAWSVFDAMTPRDHLAMSLLVVTLAESLGVNLAKLPPAEAFREGIAFFQALREREWTKLLEELHTAFLQFIAEGVEPAVVRDLISELPSVFGSEIPSFIYLEALIETWLSYLELPLEQRPQRLSRLDPDIATTLKSLEKYLSPKAKQRYRIADVGTAAHNITP